MSDVRISVIIPSIDRHTLGAALDSCAAADEVIVMLNRDGDHGYKARTEGIAKATGTHLAFLDDDDAYTDGAIDVFREYAEPVPVIFRMDDPQHGILWREPRLAFSNVGTPMFLVPNIPDRLGVWAPHHPGWAAPGGDYTFIKGCCDAMGAPVWRSEVVAVVRPHMRAQNAA